MFSIYFIAPLILIIGSTYFFNKTRFTNSKKDLYFTTIVHSLFSFSLIIVLFLSSFLFTFMQLFVIIILIFMLFIPMFYFQKNYIDDLKNQFLTIGNNIIFFSRTVLPLYVFLSIFRYIEPYYQIPLSFLLVGLLFVLSSHLKKRYIPNSRDMIDFFSTWRNRKKFAIPVITVILIILVFNIPIYNLEVSLNLSNNVRYLEYDRLPVDISNDYHQDELIQMEVDLYNFDIIQGYAYYANNIYLLIGRDIDNDQQLNIYNKTTGELVSSVVYEDSTDEFTNNVYLVEGADISIITDNYEYLAGIEGHYYYKIEVLDNGGNPYSYFNHIMLQKLTNLNKYGYSKVDLYRNNNGTIEFIQSDGYYDERVITLYQLVQKETYIDLPFYSHYSINTFAWILIGFLVPYIGKENPVETISFENAMKGKYTPKKIIEPNKNEA